MASFSVDITDIIFAGGRTGYKVVTISNGPSGGITARLLGNNPTYFQVAAETADVSYRISTKQVSSGVARSAYVRFQNSDDSSDYVDVSLYQCVMTSSIGIMTHKPDEGIPATGNPSYTISVDNQMGSIEMWVDTYGGAGASGEVTSGSSWLSSVLQTPTDTGFLKFAAAYISNIDGQQRTGTIQYSGENIYGQCDLTIVQAAGSPTETLSVTPSSISEDYSGGTTSIAVTYRGSTYGCDYTSISSWVNVSLSQIMTGVLSGTVVVSPNASTAQRSGSVVFSDMSGSISLPIIQTGSAVTLSVDKAQISYPNSGGSDTLAVSFSAPLTTNEGSMPSWLSCSYVDVDTSHRTYNISAASNASTSARSFNFNLSDANMSLAVPITQAAAAPAVPFSVSPSTKTFYETGGEQLVSFSGSTGSVSSNVDYITPLLDVFGHQTNWLNYRYDTTYQSYKVVCDDNSGYPDRYANMIFTDENSSVAVMSIKQVGDTSISSVSPSSHTFQAVGGSQVFDVYSATSSITVAQVPDWLSITSSTYEHQTSGYHHSITVAASANSSSERECCIDFTETYNYPSYRLNHYPVYVNQVGGSVTEQIVLSPISETIGSNQEYTSNITVVSGPFELQWSCNESWVRQIYEISNPHTIRFRCDVNTSSSSRTAVITVSKEGYQSATFTLTQNGVSPGPTPTPTTGNLKVYPAKLRFYREAGRWIVSFSNVPASRIGYTITYIDGSGWLSVSNRYVDSKYVSAVANSGIRRRATIRFYDQNQTSNYVDVPVIQGSADGYDSIWIDYLYYPQDRDTDGNYYYRLINADTNYEFYRGVSTVPAGWGGNVGGIDIPRITDTYIQSGWPFSYSGDWYDMNEGYITVNLYNMTQSGYPGVLDATFKYWNDWSTTNRRYDYTRSLNDPINGRGCDNMIIPFCVYYDDAATFTIVETEKSGSVNTYTLSTPTSPFSYRDSIWYGVKTLEYRQDGEVLFSYDMDHCGPGALIYRNRFGGWDSFLIEGNIIKTDNYTKQNFHYRGGYAYNYTFMDKMTDSVDINTTYEAHTGWLTDEQAERLVFHLLSSPIVYFQDFNEENQLYNQDRTVIGMLPVRLTNSSAEYKKFRNGKKLVNYTITFEKVITEKVRN